MRYLMTLFLAAFLFACGSAGDNGGDGKDGNDGKSPSCKVEKRGDKSVMRCVNADGSIYEAEIVDGQDGQDGEPGTPGQDGQSAFASSTTCKFNWPGEGASGATEVSYNVIFMKDGASLASLYTKLVAPSTYEFIETTSAYWGGASEYAAKAIVENKAWKAELVSKTSAKIYRKGVNQERSMTCVPSQN